MLVCLRFVSRPPPLYNTASQVNGVNRAHTAFVFPAYYTCTCICDYIVLGETPVRLVILCLLQHTRQERHPLYDLLMIFLKAKQAWSSSVKEMEALRNQYATHQPLVWDTEMKDTFATVRT